MVSNMGEIASLTDKLALMPDQMLPRLAQQYKSDAITLSLILGEKTRREHVRNSMKTQAGTQPQPKVNDQVVAGMQQPQLPEDVGIGALPTPNMQHMADGGIAGYADGELIAENEPVMRMADGGVARYNERGLVQYGGPYGGENLLPNLTGYEGLSIGQAWDKFVDWLPSEKKTMDERRKKEAEALAAQQMRNYKPRPNLQQGERDVAMENAGLTPGPVETATKVDTGATKGGLPDLAQRPAAGPRLGASTGPTDFASMYNKLYKETAAEDPAAEDRAKLQEELVGGAKERLTRLKEEQAARGDVYKGREERLSKREQELEKAKDSNTGLALLEAGFAIMSTPGHWSQAVGKGAQVGTARYAEGLDKLRAAQERLGEARDRMEDLKINRADMSAKEIREATNDIDKAKLDARKLGIEGTMAAAGVKEKRAAAMFDATVKQALTREELASRERIAAMETSSRERIAAAPGAQERIALLLGGGNLEKGLVRFADIQAGKFNPTTAYTEYLSKRKEGDTVLSPQEFVTQIKSIQALMAGAPSASNKPTGKVFE